MKLILKNIITLVLLCCFLQTGHYSYSQQNTLKSTADSISYYTQKAEQSWHANTQEAIRSAKKAYQLIEFVESPKLRSEAYAQYGIVFYSQLHYDSAFYYYKKAYDLAIANNLSHSTYVSFMISALAKEGSYDSIISLVNKSIKHGGHSPENQLKLLLSQLSATITIGLTEKAESILSQVEQLAPQINNPNEMIRFNRLKGRYHNIISNYQIADSIYVHLLNQEIDANNKMDRASVLLLLAQNKMQLSSYKESSQLLLEARNIYKSVGYKYGLAKTDLLTGSLLSWMGKYKDASEYLYKALEVFETTDNPNDIQTTYYELGWIFYSIKSPEKSKSYLNKAIKIAHEIGNVSSLGDEHNAFGALYTDLKKYDLAMLHFDSAIYYHEITKSVLAKAAAKFNKAIVLEELGQRKKALSLYKETYQVDKNLNNIKGMTEGEWELGKFYLKENKFDTALHYLNLGKGHAELIDEKHFQLQIYKSLAHLHKKLGQYEKSNSYLFKALETQDALAEEKKVLELTILEATNDIKNKEKELAFLNLQKRNDEQTISLNQKTIESQRRTLILLTICILVLLILSYVIFRYLKIRTRTNNHLRELNNEIQEKQEEIMAQSIELQEANDRVNELNNFLEKSVKERTQALEDALSELDHFFYRASHDFRGPLTTLLGLVGISKGYNLSEEATTLFNKVNVTVKKLDGMVNKLQAVSFLGDFEKLKSPRSIELETEIRQIAEEVIQNKNFDGVDYTCDLKINTSIEYVVFYPAILNICLRNLIENSLVFNYSETIEIAVSAIIQEGHLVLSIEDNGIGITEDMQVDIYNMFKRTSQISTGNGLGLYIVKKAIDILNGKIELISDTRSGSTFILTFPLTGIEQRIKEETDKVYISK